MDSQLRMRKHAIRQGHMPGIPSTVSTTSVDAVPSSDAGNNNADDDAETTSSASFVVPSSSSSSSTPPAAPSTTSQTPTRQAPTTSLSSSSTPATTEEVDLTTSSSSSISTSSTPPATTSLTSSSSSSSSSSTSSSTPLTTTTILSTSTSSRLPATTSSTTSSSSSLSSTTSLAAVVTPTTTANSRSLVTSFVTASAALSSTLSSASGRNALAGSGSGSSDSSGPSTGTVVGIVAGALVGVVVLSGIIGYFFRTKCNNKNDEDYDENPFGSIDNAYGANQTRGEMRRDSQMLVDDNDSVHQMSELGGLHNGGGGGSGYAMAAAAGVAGGAAAAGAYGLNRANTTMTNAPPGIQRSDTVNPRPPTMIQRHYANMARNNGGPAPMPSFQPGQVINPGQYYPSPSQNQSGPYPSFPPTATGYSAQPQQQGVGHARGYSNDLAGPAEIMRTGTPEHQNPQQYFHQASESYSSGQNNIPLVNPFDSSNNVAAAADGGGQYGQQDTGRQGGMDSQARAKRTLSVRNAGLDQGEPVRDSIYGGM